MKKVKLLSGVNDDFSKWDNISSKKYHVIKNIIKNNIFSDYLTLETKGDFIEFIEKYDKRVKVIDAAYDYTNIKKDGLYVATIYYNDGSIMVESLINIAFVLFYTEKNKILKGV